MNTKHIPLIVAIALPVVFVIVLALVILIPNMNIKPQHDFIYTNEDTNNYGYYDGVQYKNTYDLKEDKIILKPRTVPPVPKDPYVPVVAPENAPKIYYYDILGQVSREISFEEAQKLSLQKGPSSPDGYNVTYDTNNEGILELFGSTNSPAYVITKGRGKKQLSGIVNNVQYYRANLNIIAWIK